MEIPLNGQLAKSGYRELAVRKGLASSLGRNTPYPETGWPRHHETTSPGC